MKTYKISESRTKSLTTIQPNNIKIKKEVDTNSFIINGELIIDADLSKPFKIKGKKKLITRIKLSWGERSNSDQNIVMVKSELNENGKNRWEINNFESDFLSLGLHPYFKLTYNDEIRCETDESKAIRKLYKEKGILKQKEIKYEYKPSTFSKEKHLFQAPLKHQFEENTPIPESVDYYLLIAEFIDGSELLYNAREINDTRTILGSNVSNIEKAFYLTGKRLTELPVQLSKLTQPFDCEAAYLPYLSWGLGGIGWYNNNEKNKNIQKIKEIRNRHNIFNSPKIYAKKGTISSIKLALASIGIEREDIKIIEWYSKDARKPVRENPFWFEIVISINLDLIGHYSDDFEYETMLLIENTKPAKTHFIKSTLCAFQKDFNIACIGQTIQRVNIDLSSVLPEETLDDWINFKSEILLSSSIQKTEFVNFQSSIVIPK